MQSVLTSFNSFNNNNAKHKKVEYIIDCKIRKAICAKCEVGIHSRAGFKIGVATKLMCSKTFSRCM